jgi:hypothetical protein
VRPPHLPFVLEARRGCAAAIDAPGRVEALDAARKPRRSVSTLSLPPIASALRRIVANVEGAAALKCSRCSSVSGRPGRRPALRPWARKRHTGCL